MKKALAAIMMCAFAVSAMAQWLIYDYKVSFKRVDAQYTKVAYEFGKYDGSKKDYVGYFDSFKSDSDTLKGYVIIPACIGCSGNWENFGSADFMAATDATVDSFNVVDKDSANAVAFIVRNDDALYKNPITKPVNGKLVWKVKVYADAAMFGKGVAARLDSALNPCFTGVDALAGKPTGRKNMKEAWMVLTYDVKSFIVKGGATKLYPPVKGLAVVSGTGTCDDTETVSYGFLGYQCKDGSISHTGFGKVTAATVGKDSKTTSISFCGSTTTVTESQTCTAINTISGTITGLFNYDGFCGNAPMFDICDLTTQTVAPVSGNWTFKLNSSASKKNGATKASAEAWVMAKLNVKADSNYFIDQTK